MVVIEKGMKPKEIPKDNQMNPNKEWNAKSPEYGDFPMKQRYMKRIRNWWKWDDQTRWTHRKLMEVKQSGGKDEIKDAQLWEIVAEVEGSRGFRYDSDVD